MKKNKILILLVILLITGCSNQSEKKEGSNQEVFKRNDEYKISNEIVNENSTLSIHEELFKSDIMFTGTGEPNILIAYPRIAGLDDNILSKINITIKKCALDAVKQDETYQADTEKIQMKFQLYANDSILSIKFSGGLADGRIKLMSTLNFDLSTGERIKFSDLYIVNSELVNYLFAGEYNHEDDRILQSHEYVLENYYEDVLPGLQNADTGEYYMNTEAKLYVYTFYKKDTVELVFYHGYNALGGHYPEELSYDELSIFKK